MSVQMVKVTGIARGEPNFQNNRSLNRSRVAASLLVAAIVVSALCAQMTPVQARIHHGRHCHHLGFHHNLAALFAARPDCAALFQELSTPTSPTTTFTAGQSLPIYFGNQGPTTQFTLTQPLAVQEMQKQEQQSEILGASINRPIIELNPNLDWRPQTENMNPNMNVSFYAPEQPLAPVFNAMPPVGAVPRVMPREVFSPKWQAWSAAFGGSSLLRADPASGDSDNKSNARGAVIGLNYLLAPETLIGISVTQSRLDFSSSDEYQSSSGGQDGTAVSLTWTQLVGPYYALANVGYTYFKNTSQRLVTGEETINASYASNQFSAGLEIGRSFVISNVSFTPFMGAQLTKLWQPTYTETSIDISDGLPGVMGQTYQASTVTSLPTSLGIQFDTRMPIGSTVLAPFLRVAWVHNFISMPNTTVINAINVVSSLEGTAAPTDSALFNAGAMLSISPNITLFGKFTGQFADRLQSYAGTGGLRFLW